MFIHTGFCYAEKMFSFRAYPEINCALNKRIAAAKRKLETLWALLTIKVQNMKTASFIKIGCLSALLIGSVGNARAGGDDGGISREHMFIAVAVGGSVLCFTAGYLSGRFVEKLSFEFSINHSLVEQNEELNTENNNLRQQAVQYVLDYIQSPSQDQR